MPGYREDLLRGWREQLVALNTYNPDILPDLESYVDEQPGLQPLPSPPLPARMNVHIIIKVLVKALMVLPATDFNLCMFLITERLQMQETFLTLTTLAHFLESSRFWEFCDEANRNRDILEVIPGKCQCNVN